LIRAIHTSEEYGHGLVSGSNLYFHEIRLFVAALTTSFLNRRLFCSYERIFSSEYIIHLFSVEMHLVFKGLLHHKDVGAGFAVKAEVGGCFLYQ
jgi:hypothetical protein